MTDVKDNSLQQLLRDLEANILDIVGDEFAPKQEGGSHDRKRLLALIGKTAPEVLATQQAILEEMDRVVAEVIGENEPTEIIEVTDTITMGRREQVMHSKLNEKRNELREEARHRWQEVRGRL